MENTISLNTSATNTHAQFVQFIDSIPMKEAGVVPADEDGLGALVDIKYHEI